MATVIGYQPLDMSGNVPGSGVVTVATSTLISVDDGWDRIDYVGSGFAFDGFGNLVGGTLNGINSYTSAGTVQVYTISGLNHSIVTFNNYLLMNDLQGAQAYIFNGNDFFSGSGGDDVALGYGGNDSMNGMDGNDLSYGGSGNDTMIGGNGNDTADGGEGADSLAGGPGNDTSVIDISDTVFENADAGIDTILADFSYTLPANFENLTLTGVSSVNGTGNTLNNVIVGNGASNVLNGGAGADTLSGGDGFAADTLDGGTGNDVLQGGEGFDTYVVDSAGDVVSDIGGFDTVYSGVTYSLAGTGVDILTLTGNSAINGTGNELGNILNGNDAANVLDGGLGADSMSGGLGDDSYVVDNFSEVVVEGPDAGVDSVSTSVTFTLPANVEHLIMTGGADGMLGGNALDNSISGSAGANGLDGGAGADTLSGGAGDDIYYHVDPADVVVENFDEGTDQIWVSTSFSLAGYANVENLRVENPGGGSSLIGNDLDNWLVSFGGGDYLDGGVGADTLSGNAGNDTYVIDNAGDVVYEYVADGIDTVRTALNGYTLGDNLDVLVMTGTGSINANGNALNNILSGNAGNNILDGAGEADIIAGGPGNDTYIVDNSGDQVMELGSSGTDAVQSGVSYDLMQAWHVENLTLTGGSAVNGSGNWLDNLIVGNSAANALTGNRGNDTLSGGAGVDTLGGGSGSDVFYFDAHGAPGADLILDFQSGLDQMVLPMSVFSAFSATGAVSGQSVQTGLESQLTAVSGNAGDGFEDYLKYASDTGHLYYDADGTGSGGLSLIATVYSGAATPAGFMLLPGDDIVIV